MLELLNLSIQYCHVPHLRGHRSNCIIDFSDKPHPTIPNKGHLNNGQSLLHQLVRYIEVLLYAHSRDADHHIKTNYIYVLNFS